MSDIVEFTLRLRDMMSGGVHKLEATTHSAFGRIDKVIQGTQRHLDRLGESRKIQLDSSDLDRAHEKMRNMASTWDVLRGTFMGGLAIEGLNRGVGASIGFLKDSLMAGMQEQKVQALLKVQKGDEAGMDLYEQTRANVLKSLYGTQMFEVSKSLTAMGLGTQDVMKKISQFEDIAFGDPAAMEQLVSSYQLIRGQKHLTQIEARPLLHMGFDPALALTRRYGGKQDDWQAKLEDSTNGLKYFDMSIDAATEKGGAFFEAQKKALGTDFGKYTLAATNWEMIKASFGEKLLPVMGKLLDKLSPLMDKLPAKLDMLIPGIEMLGNKAIDLISWLGNNTETIKTLIHTTENLIKTYLIIKGVGLVGSTYSGFMSGLSGNAAGGLMAGVAGGAGSGLSNAAIAGMVVGWMQTGVGATIASIGGIAALAAASAYAGWGIWKEFNGHDKNQTSIRENGITYNQSSSLSQGHYAVKSNVFKGDLTPAELAAIKKQAPYGWDDQGHPLSKPAAAVKNPTMGMSASGEPDAIVGGGSKVVSIHFRNFTEHFTVQAADMNKGADEVYRMFEDWWLRLLKSVPG